MSTWRGTGRPADGELLVSEVFGPTVQGEGPAVGRTASFLRLGGCNLSCAWCDTAYTWDASRHDLSLELTVRRTDEVVDDLLARGAPLVVVTGGEPLLQAAALVPLLRSLKTRGVDVHVETNGTVFAADLVGLVETFVVSPKTRNSGTAARARHRRAALVAFAETREASFKFVVTEADDLEEIDAVVASLGLSPSRVWVMPEGTTADRIVEASRWLPPSSRNAVGRWEPGCMCSCGATPAAVDGHLTRIAVNGGSLRSCLGRGPPSRSCCPAGPTARRCSSTCSRTV